MRKFFEIIDTLDSKDFLTINGKKSLHTVPGIFLSIVVILFSIVMSYSLFFEFFNKNKPSVNWNKIKVKIPDTFEFNSFHFITTIGIRDYDYNIIKDDTIATIEVKYEYHTIDEKGNIIKQEIPLNQTNCSDFQDNFLSMGTYDIYKDSIIEQYNCYSPLYYDNKQVILGGLYGTEFYGDVAFHVKPCINTTKDNKKCKDIEEISSILNGGWMEFSYTNAFIDHYNYEEPIQYSVNQFYNSLDTSINKVGYLFFNPVYFYSQNGIIFSTEKEYSGIKLDYTNSDYLSYREGGDIYTIYVNPSETYETYKRKYIKIQDIGTSIGGFFNCIHIIAALIVYNFNEKHKGLVIFNSLFSFFSYSDKVNSEMFEKFKFNIREMDFMNNDQLSELRNDDDIINRKIPYYRPHISSKNKSYKNKITLSKVSKEKSKKTSIINVKKKKKNLIKDNVYSIFQRITILKNQEIIDSKFDYKICLDDYILTKMIFCPFFSSSKKMNNSYKILEKKANEFLNIIKIYENMINNNMISYYLQNNFDILLSYKKDEIQIDALDNWKNSKTVNIFN